MHPSFQTILIPVDLSINTEIAVKKGLELAEYGTVIHLLYVQQEPFYYLSSAAHTCLIPVGGGEDDKRIEEKLSQWKTTIEECTQGVTVQSWISQEKSVEKAIEQKAKLVKADLIIIGKNSRHPWLPFLNTVVSSKMAQHTGIPVLTVKPGAIHGKTKIVLVPITGEVAKYKMEVIEALCRKFTVKVHLVTFMNNDHKPSDFNASALLQLYQWLKSSVHCPVEYAVLHGSNKAKVILNYAEKINADALLVHPETETKIGWLNKHISDVLPPSSKIQVWAVQPSG